MKFDESYREFREALQAKDKEISELKILLDERAQDCQREKDKARDLENHYRARIKQQSVGP